MTDSFIPIVSNTPPPIDEGDFDDDFTDFAQATNSWGSDDDFGDFSGPPPVSDDSFGSPLKSVQPHSFETNFCSIVDNIEAQDEIVFTAKPDDIYSNATNGVSETLERDCEPDLSSSCNATVTGDVSIDLEDRNFSNSDDLNKSFVKSPTDNEDRASSIKELENNATEPGVQGNLFNPVIAEFESDNSEYPSRDDIPSEDESSFRSQPSEETFQANDKIKSHEDFTEMTNNFETNNDVCFHEVVASHTISPVDSKASSGHKDTVSETEINLDNSGLQSDDKDSRPTSSGSMFAEETPKDSTGEVDEVESAGCQNNESSDSSSVETSTNQETTTENVQDSIPSNKPADHSEEFVDTASFNQFTNNDGFKETVVPDNFNKISDSIAEGGSPKSIESDNQDTKSCSSVEESIAQKLNAESLGENAEDDFADFATFSFPSTVQVAENESPSNDENCFAPPSGFQNSNDDFAKFDDDAGFGDFSDSNFAPVETNNDDDFGDFGSASEDFPLAESTFAQTQSNNATNISSISRWFPQCETPHDATIGQPDANIHLIHCHVEENTIPLLSCDSTSSTEVLGSNKLFKSPTQLWDLLEDVDNTMALKFKWNNSLNHQQLLTSLGINRQNILFSGNRAPTYVPNYAAGLGLLQPDTKPMSATDVVTATTPIEKTSNVDGGTPWTMETGATHSRSHSNADAGSLASGGYDAISLDFDVLDASTSKSSKLSSPPEQDKMDPELLEFALSAAPDPAQAKRSDPLSKILASLKVSSGKKVEDEEELTPDAAEILTKLPDLSYMRSHVLMFPVGKPPVVSNS